MDNELDIIWNITRICKWNCAICCVDAIKMNSKADLQHLMNQTSNDICENNLNEHKTIYSKALEYLQKQNRELALTEKLQVLRNMKGYVPKIDFSGGDPLLVDETLVVMQEANRLFGKKNITLTATGVYKPDIFLDVYAPLIDEFNFTYDSMSNHNYDNRPTHYTELNLKLSKKLVQKGIKVRAECPLTKKNIDEQNIKGIFKELHKANIQSLLLIRLFPVGRGNMLFGDIPTVEEYKKAISIFREEEKKYGYPKIKLQCAMKYLDDIEFNENPCDMGVKSFGLMPDGTLIVSPWSYGLDGKVFDNNLILGNLAKDSLDTLLNCSNARTFYSRANENFGHCKIHAYLNSQNKDQIDSYFNKTDPLYLKNNSYNSDFCEMGV